MSGSGAEKRNRALAIRCANFRAAGWPYRAIAEQVDKKPEQIKALIKLGERLKSLGAK